MTDVNIILRLAIFRYCLPIHAKFLRGSVGPDFRQTDFLFAKNLATHQHEDGLFTKTTLRRKEAIKEFKVA